MAVPSTNRFNQLKEAKQILEVDMDNAAILLPEGAPSIGTKNLNGCSGIAILGRAFIPAHIAPLPLHSLGANPDRVVQPNEGDEHFKRLMDTVQSLFANHTQSFPTKTTAWGVFGRFRDEIALPEKVHIAQERLSKLGLPLKPAFFDVRVPNSPMAPAAGTVIGLVPKGMSYLYPEDRLLHSLNFNVETGGLTELLMCSVTIF